MKASFEMVDVGGKTAGRRRALARGSLRMGPAAFELLRCGRLPKGDALALGETAGILAAKRAPETIPLCHPISLEKVAVRFELDAALPGVHAVCEAWATAKTGVEMEALAGTTAALLAVYDLVKQVDPALTITDVRLIVKEGGKSGVWRHPEEKKATAGPHGKTTALHRGSPTGRAAVIIVSDRCSRGEAQDLSGPALVQGLKDLGFAARKPLVVPDEGPRIEAAVRRLSRGSDLVLLSGGTGLSPRDVTPEAVAAACDRLIPGIGEALRSAGRTETPMASLSRSTAGQLGKALVVALPGSRSGAASGLAVLAELLPHALHVIRGGDHPR